MQNNDLTFFNTLKIRLKESNNSKKYHLEFLPKNRDFFHPKDKKAKNYKKSAVMLVLFYRENRLKSLLIERSSYKGIHSGQIGLPGGKFEPNDNNIRKTAIRETFEEISVVIKPKDILGKLTPFTISVSQFTVYPYVSYLNYVPNFVKDMNEIEAIIEFDVWDFVLNSQIIYNKVYALDQRMEVASFEISNRIVWGATAMILNEFKSVLKETSIHKG